MKTINWSGYSWETQERWGEIHPEKPNWYYGPDSVRIDNRKQLHLTSQYKPKTFQLDDGRVVKSPIQCGLVSCTEKFWHGEFEIQAKLPRGKFLWPAFWMYPWDKWPPEIDVFEGYTNNSTGYFKFRLTDLLGFWNVQSNIHYKESPYKNSMLGGDTQWFGLSNPANRFIKYKVQWYPKEINIFYNDKLVRRIDNMDIMIQMNQSPMNVIINNGIQEGYVRNKLKRQNTPFTIKYFKYKPL